MTGVAVTAGVIVHRVIVPMIGEALPGMSAGPQEIGMIGMGAIAGGTGEVGERSGRGGRCHGPPPKRTYPGMMTGRHVDHPEIDHPGMSPEDPREVRGGVRSDTVSCLFCQVTCVLQSLLKLKLAVMVLFVEGGGAVA